MKRTRPLLLLVGFPVLAGIIVTALFVHLAEGQKTQTYNLIGNIRGAKGIIETKNGSQEVLFRGQIAFRVVPDQKLGLRLVLTRLNLRNRGVKTPLGNSGVIGLSLEKPEYPTLYNRWTGKVAANSSLVLHYPLIDEIRGYRSKPKAGDANFVPFTERMTSSLKATLPKGFVPGKEGPVSFKGEIELSLDDGNPGLITNMRVYLSMELLLQSIFGPWEDAELLRVQPVFIGSGPDDPTATGVNYNTLIRRAANMWSRCGTERCLRIVANSPRYIDNDDYRVIDSEDEAIALKGEVNVADAIEIFVAERLADDMAIAWGGGATFSSGTASSKIVSSDQNLDVPCPEPCTAAAGGGLPPSCAASSATPGCGDVNYYHLAHELGHVLNLDHPGGSYGLAASSHDSVLEPSGFCCDNPDQQSAQNCRNSSNPLLYWGRARCGGTPDIMD